MYNLSTGQDKNKIFLKPVLKRILNCGMIIIPSLLFSNIVYADEIPQKAAVGVKTIKKVSKARKSTQILKAASGIFTLEEVCRKGVQRAAVEKPHSLAFTSLTSTLLILCGALGLHLIQSFVEDE